MKPFWKNTRKRKTKKHSKPSQQKPRVQTRPKPNGRTLETTDGRHNAFGKERDAAYCTGTEIGSNGLRRNTFQPDRRHETTNTIKSFG